MLHQCFRLKAKLELDVIVPRRDQVTAKLLRHAPSEVDQGLRQGIIRLFFPRHKREPAPIFLRAMNVGHSASPIFCQSIIPTHQFPLRPLLSWDGSRFDRTPSIANPASICCAAMKHIFYVTDLCPSGHDVSQR